MFSSRLNSSRSLCNAKREHRKRTQNLVLQLTVTVIGDESMNYFFDLSINHFDYKLLNKKKLQQKKAFFKRLFSGRQEHDLNFHK